jgi:hypothetical protein
MVPLGQWELPTLIGRSGSWSQVRQKIKVDTNKNILGWNSLDCSLGDSWTPYDVVMGGGLSLILGCLVFGIGVTARSGIDSPLWM